MKQQLEHTAKGAQYWKPLKIGIDFDATFDLDPVLWCSIIGIMKEKGHEVRFVTLRYDFQTDDIVYWSSYLKVDIIFCGGRQKTEVCVERDWIPDVWIDDHVIHVPTMEQINTLVDENKKRLEAEAKGETYFYNIPKINKDKL